MMKPVQFALAVLFFCFAHPALANVAFIFDETSSGFVEAGSNQPTIRTQDNGNVELQQSGPESSQCTPYGRPSAARSFANATMNNPTPSIAVIQLRADTYANGGHFRTCNGCFANACVGIHGNDTKSTARSDVKATISIHITDERRKYTYDVIIAPSSPDIVVNATFTDGSPITKSTDGPNKYIVNEKHTDFQIVLSVSSSSIDSGGCCSTTSSKVENVQIEVTPGAILSSAGQLSLHPFVHGGVS